MNSDQIYPGRLITGNSMFTLQAHGASRSCRLPVSQKSDQHRKTFYQEETVPCCAIV